MRILTPAHQFVLSSAISLAAIFAFVTPTVSAGGTEHNMEMRNKDSSGQVMAFEPAFLKVSVGDSVRFVPADPGHNAEGIPDLWPEGVAEVKGAMGKVIIFTAEKEGVYAFRCLPHYGMGMVAIVQVGQPVNLDKLRAFKAPGLAQKRFDATLAKVQ